MVGVGGILLVSAVVFGWGQSQRAAPLQPEMISPADETVAEPEPPRQERVGRQAAPGITTPPLDLTDLERIEPREPLTPLGAPEDPATRPPRETLLLRPVAITAGTIEAQGYRVSLEGIEIVAPEETCERNGQSWPCGVHARTAFRNYLRGRAISCTVPNSPADETVVSRCAIGNADPAAWLVSQGWARAVAGGPYEEQEREAVEAKRGIHAATPAEN